MHSKQRRKANRNFIHGAKKEIREVLGQALMNGGVVTADMPPSASSSAYSTRNEFLVASAAWRAGLIRLQGLRKKLLAAGLIDRLGVVTPKGLEVLKND
jgi:hypothetical protein